jgi:hypothetical protein
MVATSSNGRAATPHPARVYSVGLILVSARRIKRHHHHLLARVCMGERNNLESLDRNTREKYRGWVLEALDGDTRERYNTEARSP